MRGSIALVLGLLLAGCHTYHYVALDETPLYASPTSPRVVARLPRYHDEPLADDPEPRGGRLRVGYLGRTGYAPAESLRVVRYLDPSLDDGADRADVVGRALREAQLAHLGRAWPRHVVAAVRRGEVVRGMTRRQVEVAWGWPLTVLAGADGGERWVYQRDTTQTVHRYLSDPWSYPSSFSPYLGFYAPLGRRGWCDGGWVEMRLPVTEERVVEIGADGRVTSVHVRRFLR